ncbi:MAG: flavodoxin domain-containing protein [Dehalococcoidia bacterium]|jgi:NAD(P)H dehydrogenase (quinone)
MTKALVVYDSRSGNTEKVAKAIGEGIKAAGLDVEVKHVDKTSVDDLTAPEAVVLGSPTYFSAMTDKMKAFVDKTVKLWPGKPGPLKDKVGAVFTSCAGADGGNETTLLGLIRAMLWHGMVIVGHQSGAAGAVAVGAPDEQCIAECRQFGQRIASLVKR